MFTMIYIFTAGMGIGLLVDAAIILLHRFHMTKKFYIINYMGCLLTGKTSGNSSFIAGFAYSIIASGLLAVIYAFVIKTLQLPPTTHTAILAGSVKTVISGCIMPILDRNNRCVKNGSIAPMGLFGSDNGLAMSFIFFLGNIVYALIIVNLMAR